MKFKSMLHSSILVSVLLVGACGMRDISNQNTQRSSISSVSIPQTAVRNQMNIGFCWAYSGIGLLESKLKTGMGMQFDFSEEALGFYRIIEELSFYTKAYQADPQTTFAELTAAVQKSTLQGWIVKRDPADKSFQMRDTLELIEFYGVIPESAWNIKFSSPVKTERMTAAVKSAYLKLLQLKGRSGTITTDDYLNILAQPNAFGSIPPNQFNFNGQIITAQAFVRDVANFRASDFVSLDAKTSRDVPKIVSALKQTLARGISVPIGFGVNFSMLNKGTFTFPNRSDSEYDNIPEKESLKAFAKDGGHAVLVTDFVNKGGREGAIPAAELQVELAKSSEELSYVKVKNSWGLKAASNEGGVSIGGASDGYFRLELGYMKGSADAAFLTIVVPANIAAAIK